MLTGRKKTMVQNEQTAKQNLNVLHVYYGTTHEQLHLCESMYSGILYHHYGHYARDGTYETANCFLIACQY